METPEVLGRLGIPLRRPITRNCALPRCSNALHDPSVGINDFDVYTFYAAHPGRPWYAKRIKSVHYGEAKFGQSEISDPRYIGRRVDLLSRALDVPPGADIIDSITTYLRSGRTETSLHLAKKAVVLLEPTDRLGGIVWPPTAT
jgi:hypothetical protein